MCSALVTNLAEELRCPTLVTNVVEDLRGQQRPGGEEREEGEEGKRINVSGWGVVTLVLVARQL